MKRETIGLLWGVLFLFGASTALADVIYVSGNVSGVWSADTVAVTGEVTIPEGQSLTILPGVKVLFQAYCKFIVDTNATLIAVGTEADSIRFDEFSAGVHWNGVRFYSSSDSSRIEYCHLTNGQAPAQGADGAGGAIYINNSSPTIRHCTITGNRARSGGGIYCANSYGYIGQNVISFNWLNSNPYYYAQGGGIYYFGGSPTITENIIHHNDGTYGGGISGDYSESLLSLNVIYANTAMWNAAIDFTCTSSFYHLDCINNTIFGNTATNGPGGIAVGNAELIMNNCIIWGNSEAQVYISSTATAAISYCDIQGGMAGIGNINQDPLFVNTAAGDFQLLETSPCIDAGDPASPPDPDGSRADMGAYYFDQSGRVAVNLIPHDPPIIIPAGGGEFQFDLILANSDSLAHVVDVSTLVTLPGGLPYPILMRNNISLASGATILRPNLTQFVPGSAQPGEYIYNAYVRDHLTWETLAEDSFPFTKAVGIDAAAHEMGWILLGWDDEAASDLIMPEEFALLPAHPNPFNAQTELGYTLPRASRVRLTVYDPGGRTVATVLEGWREAGIHSVTFDASALSSGLYLLRLEDDNQVSAQKIIVLK